MRRAATGRDLAFRIKKRHSFAINDIPENMISEFDTMEIDQSPLLSSNKSACLNMVFKTFENLLKTSLI